MDHTCDSAAERVAGRLGFSCHGADPVVSFRNPFDLADGTMAALELLIVGGAVFALVHAWRRWRRDGDPVNISLWFASVVYLAVIEPPLYFPGWFGLQDHVGFIFSHNVFTVQFMYDRLPLYIVAFYPAISQLAYELVRVLGVFARRGPLVGSVAVAFACQVFYEVFDQLGPQLRWWAWNTANEKINQPALASVPMNSMLLFASVSFGAMTYLVVRLVGERDGRGPLAGPRIGRRTLVAGAVTPLAMIVVSAPSGAFEGHLGIQRAILGAELAAVWVAGILLLADAWRAGRSGEGGAVASPLFARTYPALYLGVHVVFWLVALPAYLASTGGVTERGTPIGSLWYAALCSVAATGMIVAAHRAIMFRRTAEPVRS
ncbi:hypothetical protein BKA00_003649 [Actinomadura coerulea]|uniref:Uncharacterized protein n=1 Tax=Actinomadura coerulea TaxID=46159 RepID=A0A7X0KZS4_9ACTN|nr:hypothetical protein [Actinomadura coerulea]MBB6396735.1 hypothetical protein [Actinomadura coerulea]GGP94140.1 hypothetical protein GCM10010187_06770 [Actinomadura coerulea]